MPASEEILQILDDIDTVHERLLEKIGTEISIDAKFINDIVADHMDKVKIILDKSIERSRRIETAERRVKRRAYATDQPPVVEEDAPPADADAA